MSNNKPQYTLYTFFFIILLVIGFNATAKSKVRVFFNTASNVLEEAINNDGLVSAYIIAAKFLSTEENSTTTKISKNQTTSKSANKYAKSGANSLATAAMFNTIILGADDQVGCSINGFTVARFNLCGAFDNREISLAGGPYGAISWQQLGGSCTPDINEDCPNTAPCYTILSTDPTFQLDAATVSAATGAEYRVVVDGQTFYFKVKRSNITQTFVKQDFVCGVLGRIQITNLSSAYEFSLDSGSGFVVWQGPIFQDLAAGTYNVKARLQNTANTCEYLYAPIVIEELSLTIDATFTDVLCNGETGSITVTPSGAPGPYKYTLLNSSGVAQEFTAFVATNPYTFSAVGSGTYTVQVETQQCTGDPANGINPPRQSLDTSGNPITIGAGLGALDASTEVNNSFGCDTITSVDITVNTSGGSAPYNFTVNGGAMQPPYGSTATNEGNTIFTVATAGSYNFLITDANGCTITASANVQELLPPDITAVGVDGTCSNGGSRINFTINDARGYNLSYRAISGGTWFNTPQVAVPTGSYPDVEVRYQQSGFECILELPTITVTNLGGISGTATKNSDVTCNGTSANSGGVIEFTGPFSGGSGSGYQFSIGGGSYTTTTLYSNLSAGTYALSVRDSGGCQLDLPDITIANPTPPTNLDFAQSAINCASSTATVTLSATSTASINNYAIISPVTLNNGLSNVFTNLSTSTSYIFQVTDANNCIYTEGFSPSVVSSIRARVKSGGDTRVCNGATNGNGTFIIDGFASTYTYQIDSGVTSTPQSSREVTIGPIGQGTYVINVTDTETGCTGTTTLEVEEAITLDISGSSVTPMSCANNNIGRLEAITTGGWGNNLYTLTFPSGVTVGPKSGRFFGNLSEATDSTDSNDVYTLDVIDNEGCTASFTFDLEELDTPSLSLTSADLCYAPGNLASITVASSGGGTGHEYRINNGAYQSSGFFDDLVPGTYIIEVTDDNNCSNEVTVIVPTQLSVSLVLKEEIPCGGNGTLGVNISGGEISDLSAANYTVFKDGIAVSTATVPAATFDYIVNLGQQGSYTVSVEDNNGCTDVSGPIFFVEPTNITATHTITGTSCGDANSGFVRITPDVTNGIPPFEIKFGTSGSLTYGVSDDGANTFSSQNVYSGLSVGTYEYLVKDSRGCLLTGIIPVTVNLDGDPAPEVTVAGIDATCSSNEVSGGIEISAITNGGSEYSYAIEDLFGNVVFTGTTNSSTVYPILINNNAIVPGDYRVIVTDSRGCNDIEIVTVSSGAVTINPDNSTLPIICTPGGFTYCVTIAGGTGPFNVGILGDATSYANLGGTPPSPDRRSCFSNIQFGQTFTVEVTDLATNCTYQELIEVPDGPSSLEVNLTIDNATCIPGNLVGLSYNVQFSSGLLDIEIQDVATGTTYLIETRSETTFTYQVPEGAYSILIYDQGTTCTDGDNAVATLNEPRVAVIENINANCNADGQLTVRGSGGDGGPYEYAYVPEGTPVDTSGSGTATTADDFTTATTVTLQGAITPGITYDIWVRDGRNCAYKITAAVISEDPPLPTPTFEVSNQCDVSASSFSISLFMPANIAMPNFTLGGINRAATFDSADNRWEAIFTVNSVGAYSVDVMDANGCTGFAEPEVFQALSASGGFTMEPTCTDADGIITVVADGGSGTFTYELQTSAGVIIASNNTGIFNGYTTGSYQVVVTDDLVTDGTINCFTVVENIISTAPTTPSIASAEASNINCAGGTYGSVDIILDAGSDVDGIREYNLYNGQLPLGSSPTVIDTNISGSFISLPAGNYIVQVITDKGCTAEMNATVEEPASFAFTATAPDFACDPGANRFSSTTITVNVTSPGTIGTGYQYSITDFSDYQSSNTFEIVNDGMPQNITVYGIDGNGCQRTFVLPTINPPSDVVPTIADVTELTCTSAERVRVQVTGTIDFTVNTTSATPVAAVDNVAGNNYVDIDLPNEGDYIFEITDNDGGCTYPMPIYTVNPVVLPEVTIIEAKPVSCFIPGDDGALFIAVTNYTGTYTYTVYKAEDTAQSTIITTGNFDTNNYPDASGEAARITGLTGGNYIVNVTAIGTPFCSGQSNVTGIGAPNEALQVNTTAVGNVGCSNNLGQIEAIGQGGWDTFAYEYSLFRSTDGGASYTTEIAPFSPVNQFTDLAAGFYQVEIKDEEACTAISEIELAIVPQIDAGIRQPEGLECPNGNNAILEAYDPTTGTENTATAGATGGFAGAGYNYRLLYLNSGDNTDIASTSGLQNSPTFTGSSGGYLSLGWYAIEVSSSFNCIFITAPYYVNPPPAIEPLLVQTRVPGCGGTGEMRLSIENPEASFTYEYLQIESGTAVGSYVAIAGNSVLISGTEGITYQFDVRKANVASVCLAVRSNGITMTDATGVTILANAPDDVSCASELDGRIESTINGGVGNDIFYLYTGDPGDAFAPNATATLVQGPASYGTFEGLPQGTEYYIAVTSGSTCMDVAGPFEIVRPEPIIFGSSTIATSCNGSEDGSITLEVISGGVGLIQFAIAPNFNEFFSDPAAPNTYTFENLEGGTYEILIQDENGCFEKDFITVNAPNELLISTVQTTAELCVGANDGTANFSVSGGTLFNDILISPTPYYEYKVEMIAPIDETGTGIFTSYDNQVLENLQGGASYALYVQDANLCDAMELFTVALGVDLTATPVVEYGCDGIFPNSTSTIQLADQRVRNDVLYALDPVDATDAITSFAGTTNTWGDLAAGEHTVYIYHENGCTDSVVFSTESYAPITLNAIKTAPNQFQANAEGGYGTYEYFFNNESYGSESTYTTTQSENVSVRVVDARGCVANLVVPFEFTETPDIPNFFTPNGDVLNELWKIDNKEFFPNLEVKIYDRYGRVVANLAEIEGWDGTYDGKELPTGDYWYVIFTNDKQDKRFVGHFTLYR